MLAGYSFEHQDVDGCLKPLGRHIVTVIEKSLMRPMHYNRDDMCYASKIS